MATLEPASQPQSSRVEGPYVGPCSFTEKDRDVFHGRDREAQRLLALTISERVVLFYAQSGAGKTSLVNARLIPGLRDEGFHVFPPARVGLPLPRKEVPANVYAYSALERLSPKRKLDETLDGFLREHRAQQPSADVPRVLILDQFEEILTSHPQYWEQRPAFFQQLRKALQDDPSLSVVLVLREDRVAGLDRYAVEIPGGLRVRFYMERLRVKEAITAIRKPAELAGRPFEPGVAEQLAQDLSQIRIAEQENPVPGESVEPVQLQVVCLQLWKNLRDRPGATITAKDLKDFGNVDEALEAFYTDAVTEAARKSGIPPGRIRQWCSTALITPSRIRSQVARQARTTGDLPNDAVESLEKAHLLRSETARGGIWYELAHDRLVAPILRSNQKWLGTDQGQLAEDARAWQSYGRDSSFLYHGKRLQEALEAKEAKSGLEQEFLAASKKRATFLNRAKNVAIAILALGLIISLGLAYTARQQWQSASNQRQIASSRELAFAAMNVTESDAPLGLALSLAALDRSETTAAEAALHQGLGATAIHEVWSLPLTDLVALSPDGRRLATSDSQNGLAVWDTRTRQKLPLPQLPSTSAATALAFDRTGRLLASGQADGRVIVVSLDGGPRQEIVLGEDAINAIAFSPDRRRLAVAVYNSPETVLWDLSTRQRTTLRGHLDIVSGIAFSQDGRQVATSGDDGQLIFWDVASGQQTSPPIEDADGLVSFALSPKGLVALFGQSGSVSLRTPDGEKSTISELKSPMLQAAFSPDDKYLVGIDSEGGFHIWDAGSGEKLFTTILGHEISSASFSADLRFLVTSEASFLSEKTRGQARLWNVELLSARPVLQGEPTSMAFRADGSLLLAAADGEVVTWDPGSSRRQSTKRFKAPSWETPLALSANGSALACARKNGGIEVWSTEGLAAGGLQSTIQAFPESYSPFMDHFDLSPDGRILAVASGDAVHSWDLATGRALASPTTETVRSLDLSSERLATGHLDGSVRLWSIEPTLPEPLHQLPASDISVRTMAFSPGGERLAILRVDGSVQIWEIASDKIYPILLPPRVRVRAVAFTANGRRIATASDERTVDLWDAQNGNDLFRLRTYLQPVAALAFRPDGKTLAVALEDGTVSIEPLDLPDLRWLARERSREPNAQEKAKYGLD